MKTKQSVHSTSTPIGALTGNAFARVADASYTDGNAIKLHRDGAENFPVWLSAIGDAQRFVHLENYILQEDAVGSSFAAALISAAGRGVRCRVIYDWLGCRRRSSAPFWDRLRAGGVEVRCYNPPRFSSPLGWVSRDHRKLLCVDGAVAYTGGLCIGHDWVGDPNHGIAPWRDTAIEIRGPAVQSLEAAFADSWSKMGPPIPAAELPVPETTPHQGDLSAWVIAGHPDNAGLYRLEQLVADIAEKSLWLADAYFVATTGYVRALSGAARAGVDVRLLVPGSSNFPVVRALSQSGYRALLEAGVRVFEWNGPMMHAKTAVADGCWSRVGSSNSNLASWIANRELDVTIQSPAFAAEMEAMYRHDLENATEIVLEAGRVRSASPRVVSPDRKRRRAANAGRFVAGAVGFSSVISATLTRQRILGPAEARVLAIAGCLLIVIAAAAFFAPLLVTYPLGIVATWVAMTLLSRAWRLYKSGRNG